MNAFTHSKTRSQSPFFHPVIGFLQRQCRCGQKTATGGKCPQCSRKEQELQRSDTGGEKAGAATPPIVHTVTQSSGRPLDKSTRDFMEPRFEHDFSRVRVHTDARAAESAQAVSALAYTVGRNIVFGAGQYAPATDSGRRLIAHELAHVVQQSGGDPTPQKHLRVGAENSYYEAEASRTAERVAAGDFASRLTPLSSGRIQRTMVCSKRLEAPIVGLFANHAFIDDTGRDDCLGAGLVGNYAVTDLISGNFVRGCAVKTDHSPDPRGKTPNRKPCRPKAGVTDLSRCLRDTFNSYASPNLYSNEAVAAGAAGGGVAGGVAGGFVGSRLGGPLGGIVGGVGGAFGGAYVGARLASGANGPNSNTFAATLARACCEDASDSGLGWVPGWIHAPAPPCPTSASPVLTA